jgi:hypothetical protein
MMYAVSLIIVLLGAGLLALGWQAYQNHLEISRLRRNGHRRVACRRLSERGGVHPDFLRALAELSLLVLLLAAVLGWLGAADPPVR